MAGMDPVNGLPFANTTRPNPNDETRVFPKVDYRFENEDVGVCYNSPPSAVVANAVRDGKSITILGKKYIPEPTEPLIDRVRKSNLQADREQVLIKEQRELIYRMRQVIWSVIQWNEEYQHINNLSGQPSWVTTAHDVFMDSRPK